MTQPQQNPWDVVSVNHFCDDGWESRKCSVGNIEARIMAELLSRDGCFDGLHATLRNGQIIRVRPKR